jgi:hypothetical protein
VVGVDDEPQAPEEVAKKFVKQCGVLSRDHIPIIVQEWNRPSSGGVPYVGDVAKDKLFDRLVLNFLLPRLDVNPDEKEKANEELLKRVKKFAMIKMAEAFKNWKKKLYLKFVKLDKTPDFNQAGYAKLKH